jgi:hypothetical protein
MNSPDVIEAFEIELDEKSKVGSEFMARVVNELRRALAAEKGKRKLTQQEIADRIGTSRAVINRQVQGLENLGARRIAEILWAIGWEPHFEARPIPAGNNEFVRPSAITPHESDLGNHAERASALDDASAGKERAPRAADLAYAA